jgi:cyclohexanone monooxygenase
MTTTGVSAVTTDVVIVGAGFSGMYLLHLCRGIGLSVQVVEAGSDVGGTWYWNRYPGARCDVESLQYSYTFSDEIAREWQWSERYAAGGEINAYQRFVADRLDLRRDILFNTRVTRAVHDAGQNIWDVETDTGRIFRGRFLVMATGVLSQTRIPDFPGIENFAGKTYHPGAWPHEGVDFRGKRVGVIGTGSSGVQIIPEIAKAAERLTVFQRTPCYSVPAQNRPLEQAERREFYANRREHIRTMREVARNAALYEVGERKALETSEAERRAEYERRWAIGGGTFMYAFADLVTDEAANRTAADFVRAKIREVVSDRRVADKLCGQDYPIGTKRICIDTGYFSTFNRPNVELVDLRSEPIICITPNGIRTTAKEFPLDAIVFATGYDAITGAVTRIDVRGRDGVSLAEKWREAPINYLGLATAGFPNFFTMIGPGSPSVLSNVVGSIEQHAEWLASLLGYAKRQDIASIEADAEAETRWMQHCAELAARTLHGKAKSWYQGDNVPGKTRVFMPYIGGTNTFRRICDDIAVNGYEGFNLTGSNGALLRKNVG